VFEKSMSRWVDLARGWRAGWRVAAARGGTQAP
jgi:hypothetical protein